MKISFVFLLVFSPFLLIGQIQVGLMVGLFPKGTETKILVPVGMEMKIGERSSVYVEYGIPLFKQHNFLKNGQSHKFTGQYRHYNNLDKRFKRFIGFELNYHPEHYSKGTGSYKTASGAKRVLFNSADVSSTITGVCVEFGGQRVYNSRIIFEWAAGIGLKQRNVTYSNVAVRQPQTSSSYDPFGIGAFLGTLVSGFGGSSSSSSSGSKLFAPPPDTEAGKHGYLALSFDLRLGYLFVSN
jgi:hypothetical protein